MVTLSELVAYRNHIDTLLIPHPESVALQLCGPALVHSKSHQQQFPAILQELEQHSSAINQSVESFNNVLVNLRTQLNELIQQEEVAHYEDSLTRYKNNTGESPEFILNRQLEISDEDRAHIHSRLSLYSSWLYPGLVLRPCTDTWVDILVGSDPLYIVDTDMHYIKPVMERFSKEYQRRLRPYAIIESTDKPMLSILPNSQFSLCLAYYHFNFKPMEVVLNYIAEVFTKLRPGGCFAMTINNCDNWGGVALSESKFATYTPLSKIVDFAIKTGYSIGPVRHFDNSVSWVELIKPGQLQSIRSGQTLAKIIPK